MRLFTEWFNLVEKRKRALWSSAICSLLYSSMRDESKARLYRSSSVNKACIVEGRYKLGGGFILWSGGEFLGEGRFFRRKSRPRGYFILPRRRHLQGAKLFYDTGKLLHAAAAVQTKFLRSMWADTEAHRVDQDGQSGDDVLTRRRPELQSIHSGIGLRLQHSNSKDRLCEISFSLYVLLLFQVWMKVW